MLTPVEYEVRHATVPEIKQADRARPMAHHNLCETRDGIGPTMPPATPPPTEAVPTDCDVTDAARQLVHHRPPTVHAARSATVICQILVYPSKWRRSEKRV